MFRRIPCRSVLKPFPFSVSRRGDIKILERACLSLDSVSCFDTPVIIMLDFFYFADQVGNFY